MLNIYICEDSENFRAHLVNLIRKDIFEERRNMEIVLDTANPHIVLNAAKSGTKNNLYFLDIELFADINGIELASQIRAIDPTAYIIFVTADAEKFLMTFEYKVQALDYIVKSDVCNIKQNLKKCLAYVEKQIQHIKNSTRKVFSFKSADTLAYIPLDDIIYIKTENAHHKKLSLTTPNAIYQFKDTLSGAISKIDDLAPHNFVKSSESMYLNIDKVKTLNVKNRTVTLFNDQNIDVSRRQAKVIREKLSKI